MNKSGESGHTFNIVRVTGLNKIFCKQFSIVVTLDVTRNYFFFVNVYWLTTQSLLQGSWSAFLRGYLHHAILRHAAQVCFLAYSEGVGESSHQAMGQSPSGV